MRRSTILIAVSVLVLLVGGAIVGRPQQPNQIGKSPFMQAKLRHTQEIVRGLALEDFAAISKGARDLVLMSNESNWNVLTTPEYLDLSREFRMSADRLHRAAGEKNIDAATLAYFEVVLNCVRCHKHTRPKLHSGPGGP